MATRRGCPRLDAGMQGWIVSTAKRNLWRVAHWYSLDDLIGDGYVAYAECRKRYGHIQERSHFMALFKRVYMSKITDLANDRTKRPSETLFSQMVNQRGEPLAWEELAGIELEQGSLAALLATAPKEITQAINLVLSDAREINAPFRRRLDRSRETTNERLCRLMGLGEGVDIVGMVRQYLMPA